MSLRLTWIDGRYGRCRVCRSEITPTRKLGALGESLRIAHLNGSPVCESHARQYEADLVRVEDDWCDKLRQAAESTNADERK